MGNLGSDDCFNLLVLNKKGTHKRKTFSIYYPLYAHEYTNEEFSGLHLQCYDDNGTEIDIIIPERRLRRIINMCKKRLKQLDELRIKDD